MKLSKINLLFILAGLLLATPAWADISTRGCETNTMKSGTFCKWTEGKSWCAGNTLTCAVESVTACPANTGVGTYSFNCNVNACTMTCINPLPTGCSAYAANCIDCASCNAGYTLSGNTCVTATLKLGSSSVFGASVIQAGADASLFVNGGRVGIGSSTPASNLFIKASTGVEGFRILSSDFSPFIIRNTADSEDLFRVDQNGNVTFKGIISGANSPWIVNGNNLFASTTAWNVGIGTTTATEKLTIQTNATSGEQAALTLRHALTGAGDNVAIRFWPAGGYSGMTLPGKIVATAPAGNNIGFNFVTNNSGVANTAFSILPTGYVAVGTTTPGSKFHVYDTTVSDTYITLENAGGAGSGFRFLRNPTGYDNGFKNNAGIFYITTSANNFASENNRLSVDYNGNVGIGGDITAGTDFTGASMVIKSGNVGIGTSSPDAKLDVAGNVTNSVQAILARGNDDHFQLYASNGDGTNVTGSLVSKFGMRYKGAGDAAVINFFRGGSSQDGSMSFATNQVERIYITSGGNVGVGTSTPATRLTVVGSGNYSIDASNFRIGNVATPVLSLDAVNKSYMDSALAAATSSMSALPVGTSGDTLRLNGATWVSNSLLYNNGVNIGIGTSSPADKLHIFGGNIRLSNNYGINTLSSAGTLLNLLKVTAADNLTFGPSVAGSDTYIYGGDGTSNRYLVIKSTGSIGIGVATPQSKLDIEGNLSVGATYSGTTAAPANGLIVEGNVGIGTTTPATRLTVLGSGNYSIDATNFRIGNVAVPVTALDAVNKSYMDSALAAATSSITSMPAGTSGYTLRHNGTSWLSNNTIFNDGTNVGIGTTTLGIYKLTVAGATKVSGQITTNLTGSSSRCVYVDAAGNLGAKLVDCGTATGGDEMGAHSATQNIRLNTYWLTGDGTTGEGLYINDSGEVGVGTNTITAGNRLTINGNLTSAGTVAFTGVTFAGGGNRMITVDNSGVLGAAAMPVDTNTDIYWTGTATNLVAATGRTSLGLGALATLGAVSGGTGTTITDDTITNADINSAAAIAASKIENGAYFINAAGTSGQLWTSDGIGAGAWVNAPVTGLTGTGTASYIPKWTSATAQGNSIIYDNGTYVGIGTASPGTYKLNVNGATNLGGNLVTTGTVSYTGVVFAGGGNRMITVDNAGVLGAAAIPVDTNTDVYWTGTATNLVAATGRTSLGLGALATLGAVSGGTGTTITDDTITNADINSAAAIAASKIENGSFFINAAGTSGQLWTSDGIGAGAWVNAPVTGVTGTGTASYIPRWTSGSALGNSIIYDNGTYVGIGTAVPGTYKLNVNGATNLGGNLVTTGTVSLTGAVYAGGGNRMITVDNTGVLGAAAIPVDTNTDIYWTGTATNLVAATARTSLGLGALATLSAVGSTEITDLSIMNADINASAAIADSKIVSGSYFITAAGTSGQIWTSDGVGAGAWSNNTSHTGSGASNYIAKWTGAGSLANSTVYDNGTNVGINTTTAATRLTVVGSGNYSIDVANFRIGGVATPVSALDAVNKSYLDSVVTSATLWGGTTAANIWTLNSGNVGVGTTSPSAKLHVLGNAIISSSLTMGGDINMGGNNITNLNKLTVNTVDPLYNIKGTNYSTYAASVVGGVKEEYVGKIKITRSSLTEAGEYEAKIDFNKVKEGSDLWVWHQVVDFSPENIQVLITPYRSFASVYYDIEGEQLIFRSDKPAEISYRLIGKRIDWLKWPTKSLDQEEKAGFKID